MVIDSQPFDHSPAVLLLGWRAERIGTRSNEGSPTSDAESSAGTVGYGYCSNYEVEIKRIC